MRHNEEDGRHGLRGCSEVGELVRMRSNGEGGAPWPEGSSAAASPGNRSQRGRAGGAADGAEGRREVGELVRMRNEEDGRHGLRGCSEVGELVRMRSKRRRRGAVARRVVGGRQPLGTNRSRRLATDAE